VLVAMDNSDKKCQVTFCLKKMISQAEVVMI